MAEPHVLACIQIARPKVSEWITTVSKCLDTGSDLVLEDMHITRPTPVYDERVQVLAREAALLLPAPLRTLLVALSELKQDIVNDKIRQVNNFESIIIAELNSQVDYACACIRRCSETVKDALANGVESFNDSLLRSSIRQVLGEIPVSKWHESLASHLTKLETRLHEEMRVQTASIPVVASVSNSLGAQKALDAVAESERIRNRLIALSAGPLSELFEPRETAAHVNLETEHTKAPRDHKTQGTLVEDIKSTKQLMRRVRSALDGIRRDQEVTIDDAIGMCVHSLRTAVTPLASITIKPNDTMTRADAALQKEIAYVLNTLSTDSVSLDLVLRAIRSKCNGLEESMAIESTGAWAIRLAGWKMQLCEAHENLMKDSKLFQQ